MKNILRASIVALAICIGGLLIEAPWRAPEIVGATEPPVRHSGKESNGITAGYSGGGGVPVVPGFTTTVNGNSLSTVVVSSTTAHTSSTPLVVSTGTVR